MNQTLFITPEENQYYETLLAMTGNEIYDKYGLKRDETFVHTANFGNDIEVDIKLVICDGDDKPYTEGVLFENGHEMTVTDTRDTMLGEWDFEHDNQNYNVLTCLTGIEK